MRIKFASLTNAQREQVKTFLKDEVKDKKVTLNQMSFRVNPTDGNVIFGKDF